MFEAAYAALFGLLVGSFLNVCIHRWPRDLSVVRPRSHCPHCGHQLAWFDNMPVMSYLLLRGRCRYCRRPISARYPAVELLTAALFFLRPLPIRTPQPRQRYAEGSPVWGVWFFLNDFWRLLLVYPDAAIRVFLTY